MRRHLVLTLGLTAAAVAPSWAASFERTSLAPDVGLDVLTRRVTREHLGRDLFSDPWATVTLATTDVYDRFPYLETRRFQIVSDPRWNRLVAGEPGQGLTAWDGRGSSLGALAEPRGLAADEWNRVYVADAGNDRIVVLQAHTEFAAITLTPLYAIDDVERPFDVAWSDGGTPFAPADDHLYVAETGRNRVAAFAVGTTAARRVATLGDLGSGDGRFGGPTAIATAMAGGVAQVFVADAHNRRLVRLRHDGAGLGWAGSVRTDATLVTALDTDQWGNLYAAAPREGVVRKYGPALEPVAELRDAAAPRAVHVPFVTVRDHRDGSVRRAGHPGALTLERWSDDRGLALWTLGLEVRDLAVDAGASQAAFTLTDHAAVTVEILDGANGAVRSRRPLGSLAAGVHAVALSAAERTAGAGGRVRIAAASSYPGGPSAQAAAPLPGQATAASRAMLLGNTPNPVVDATRIAFALPASGADAATLTIVDALGRRVRVWRGGFRPGVNEVAWDGRDEHGAPVRAGVYFCRLERDAEHDVRRMVVVR